MHAYFKVSLLVALCGVQALAASAGDGQTDFRPDGAQTYQITTPGSYVLSGDVVMTAQVSAISVGVPNVALDLNGHTITGMGSGNTALGVDASVAANFTLRNGAIRAFTEDGVATFVQARVEKVSVQSCGRFGIMLGAGSVVEDCQLDSNGGSGLGMLLPSNDCIVRHCSFKYNNTWGAQLGEGALVEDCVAAGNNTGGDGGGIRVGASSSVLNCVIRKNSPAASPDTHSVRGIFAESDSTLVGNTITGQTATGSGVCEAIYADNHCTISHNTISDLHSGPDAGSVLRAINCTQGNLIEGNAISDIWSDVGAGGIVTAIDASGTSTIRNNQCSKIIGVSINADMRGLSFGYQSTVEGNSVVGDGNTVAGAVGIYGYGANSIIRGNRVSGFALASIKIGSNGTNNVIVGNFVAGPVAAPVTNTIGSGDLANLLF